MHSFNSKPENHINWPNNLFIFLEAQCGSYKARFTTPPPGDVVRHFHTHTQFIFQTIKVRCTGTFAVHIWPVQLLLKPNRRPQTIALLDWLSYLNPRTGWLPGESRSSWFAVANSHQWCHSASSVRHWSTPAHPSQRQPTHERERREETLYRCFGVGHFRMSTGAGNPFMILVA